MDQSSQANNSAKICRKHGKQYDIINIFDTENPFNCIRCIRQKGIKIENLIRFDELLDNDETYFLKNFPPLEEAVSNRMNDLSEFLDSNSGLLQQIEDYFVSLQAEIDNCITSAKNQAKGKAIKLLKQKDETFNKYNALFPRSELKQILLEGGENMENKIGEILKIIINEEQIKKNSKILEKSLDEYKILRESLNFDIPNKIKNCVPNLISSIDFFSGVTQQQFDDSLMQVNNQEQIEGSNCSLLMDLIATPANFCTEEFLAKTKKMIDSLSFYINKCDLGFNALEQLTKTSRTQVAILSKKIIEISEQYQSENVPQQEIKYSIQPKSYCFLSMQKQDIPKKDLQNLEQLLKQFPILELSADSFEIKSILNQVELIKSKSQDSEEQIISREINGNLVSQNNTGGWMVNYCNFILNPIKKYIFRIQLTQLENNNDNSLWFGLFPDSCKDEGDLYDHQMVYSENSNEWMSQILKGDELNRGDGNIVNREFEMRIHLKKKLLQVSDYPNCENVCELDDSSKIESNVDYRFSMESAQQSAIMKITEILEVSSFEDKM